jgi:predicted ribosome quality control (RQC) complex YloA/Tae2 family protein
VLTPPEEAPPERPSRLQPLAGADFPFAAAAEALLGTTAQEARADSARRRLMGPVKAKLTRLQRTLEKVRAEADRTEEVERHRRLGELIHRNLAALTRGGPAKVVDWTAEGPVEVELELDPARTPQEQAERHFHQYRRLQRGMEHARRRLAELEQEEAPLRAELTRLAALEDEALLQSAPPETSARPPPPPRRSGYREYQAANGRRILVGKDARGNDALTFKVARPQDLWLHARGVPGSHVVVPLERDEEPPVELLLDAAHLAAHASELKGEARAEVAYTRVKFVRRQVPGAPGQVTYTREKSLMLRVEPERLQRLLRSAEERPERAR